MNHLRPHQPVTILIKQYKFLRELVFYCFGKGLRAEVSAEIDDRENDPIGVGLLIGEDKADDFGDGRRLHAVKVGVLYAFRPFLGKRELAHAERAESERVGNDVIEAERPWLLRIRGEYRHLNMADLILPCVREGGGKPVDGLYSRRLRSLVFANESDYFPHMPDKPAAALRVDKLREFIRELREAYSRLRVRSVGYAAPREQSTSRVFDAVIRIAFCRLTRFGVEKEAPCEYRKDTGEAVEVLEHPEYEPPHIGRIRALIGFILGEMSVREEFAPFISHAFHRPFHPWEALSAAP